MVDGAAMMLTDLLSRIHAGQWNRARGTNTFDGGAPFYRTYETSDGRFMAVGAIEPQFYGELLRGLDVQDLAAARQYDPEAWPETTKRFASAFRSQSQAYWTSVFAQLEACVSPVLGWDQLTSDPHLEARQLFTPTAGGIVPSSAPRFTDLIDGTHRALPGGPWDAV
jgi:alpha-methylacyl-CoA racemase